MNLVGPAVPSVPVALNHVAGSSPCARTDERAFPAADDGAADAADGAADERALSPAVVTTAMPPLGEAVDSESPEEQEEPDERGYNSSAEN